MLDAYIYAGLRTPFGRQAGALAPVRPDGLVAAVIRKLLADSPFAVDQIEDVILGCACQAGEDSRNIARHAVLLSGLPASVPGQTVNRLCSSGLAAVLDAARAISSGEGDLYIAGGVESMSRAPFVVGKSEAAFGRDFKVFDSAIGARFPNPRITAQYGGDTMPETADNVARELGLSREDSDRFAALSQSRYAKAKAEGFFDGEIMPIEVPTGKKTLPRIVSEDEHPRPDTTFETLSRLKVLHEGGVVTAGSASGVNDGAVAMFVGNRAAGEKAGAKPLARILAGAAAGVEPRVMGIGPAQAIPKALARAGRTLADMDVIEINEAFSAQVLGCLKLLGVAFDDPRVNPNGGAIALGHPLGASGARLALTAVRELQRRNGRYAVLSLCIGVGQGLAVVIERL
ncbi:MAG TPA: 3-oxoadipyl-CoA thiolase [Noviherbaspirillum sp.]|uniref:3-oxoadipyl-CoA thiolase n=1 Tax=Noviherbaspirillum sp. TaxID=1926288 RepID=UPI002B45A2A0|nr:3-oxoadipyl-CoA thiolase [Noviherbaspirillum sp.]HJV84664.1 3-oxoadipyl-CoA thiolase [Noviherbaspirillum sp.]